MGGRGARLDRELSRFSGHLHTSILYTSLLDARPVDADATCQARRGEACMGNPNRGILQLHTSAGGAQKIVLGRAKILSACAIILTLCSFALGQFRAQKDAREEARHYHREKLRNQLRALAADSDERDFESQFSQDGLNTRTHAAASTRVPPTCEIEAGIRLPPSSTRSTSRCDPSTLRRFGRMARRGPQWYARHRRHTLVLAMRRRRR